MTPSDNPKHMVPTIFGPPVDLHAYIAPALRLKAHGHTPLIAIIPVYREKAERHELGFHTARPALRKLQVFDVGHSGRAGDGAPAVPPGRCSGCY